MPFGISSGSIKALKAKAATQEQTTLQESRTDIQKDIERGEAQLGKEFEEGALGRLDVARSADLASIIEQRREGAKGLSSEEAQALRERGTQEIDRGTQTALRQLRGRQGISGVRGAAGVAQEVNVLGAGQQAKAQSERELLIKNIEAKRQGLGEFEESLTGAESSEEARRLFNLEQQQKEKFGRLSSGLGFAQLGVQERASIRGVAAAQSNVQSAAGGGKL